MNAVWPRSLTVQLASALALLPLTAPGQTPAASKSLSGDSVSIRIVATELRAAVRILGQYLDRPVLFSGAGSSLVTIEAPQAVARDGVLPLLRGLLESEGYELLVDSAAHLYRARPRAPLSMPVAPAVIPPTRGAADLELFVIALAHARAADVAQTVSALFGRAGSAMATAESPIAAVPGEDLRVSALPRAVAMPPPASPNVASRAALLTGDAAVVPDARANSLLVRANRSDFELIRAMVQHLDVRPLQVVIEVLIAEVRRDRSLTLGASGSLPATTVGKNGASMAAAAGADGGPGLGDFVLRVMGIGGLDVGAALHAAAERGDVRILSRPVILAANNERAEIVVGTQRPFVQVSRALPTETALRDQIVQYRDVGTKLTVRPTIGGDGSVQMEVIQEVSSATSETQFNAPVIATRSIQTHLLARDGQMIVLGGLTDRQREVVRGGVPFLSAIPILGGFFGHASHRTTETELFVFLTPRVIRTDDDGMRVTAPLRERAGRAKP